MLRDLKILRVPSTKILLADKTAYNLGNQLSLVVNVHLEAKMLLKGLMVD